MDKNQFLTEARAVLKTDPFSRVAPHTKALIDKPDCLFDTHSHVFDRKCIKIDYFLIRMALSPFRNIIDRLFKRDGVTTLEGLNAAFTDSHPEEIIYDKLRVETVLEGFVVPTDEEVEWERLERLLESMESESSALETLALEKTKISELRDAIKIIKQDSMAGVFKLFKNQHAVTNVARYKNRPFVSVILMMDLETGWGKKTRKDYWEQVSEINTLANTEAILPFLAVDPRRKDLYEVFLEAFCKPHSRFFGVKLYPSFGYAPSDSVLHPIYELCEEFNIPLTSHCGGTAVSTFHREVVVNKCTEKTCQQYRITGTRKEIATRLNEPSEWAQVLNIYERLKINLAHFGGGHVWEHYGSRPADPRITTIEQLMEAYPGVYTDFSFNLGDRNLDNAFLSGMNASTVFPKRAMFGTDFKPIP